MATIKKTTEMNENNFPTDIMSEMFSQLVEHGQPFHTMYGISEFYTEKYVKAIFTFLWNNRNVPDVLEFAKHSPIPEIWEMFFIPSNDPQMHESPTNTVNYIQSFKNQLTLLDGKMKKVMSWMSANGIKNSWNIKTKSNVLTPTEMGQILLENEWATKRFLQSASDATIRKTYREYVKSMSSDNDGIIDESDE